MEREMEQSTGLFELYRGEDPVIDIVAIYGLNGHPFKTWSADKTSKSWLQNTNLLPGNLKQSRILTFGYNATVAAFFGKTSSDRILQHAHTLIVELVANREVRPSHIPPAEQANSSNTSSIDTSTYAILFLSTPHNGSNKASLASVSSRLITALAPSKLADSSSQLADALHEGLEVVQNITDMLAPLVKNLRIYFF
ncbi:hypothetical protein COCSADRAFT_165160 [Bipolaris sorokiniana ND90Pr]|uniref:Uncharacterized protein n=1 Tax=Cochliobolus sativus (strain ND90Pr / ATCC 201652) TaxID=665912 RepID=M2QUU4_COCSN|nr:uncharacterized protein COCSADRAFT_165160 [Bipolaris sorokiniana ND90Pr]EMD58909.1 hypothetical protein COCSADRAFT_165160 [Bipolaris sorokiniana ND90Pr]